MDIGCGLGSATFAVLNRLSNVPYERLHIDLNDTNNFIVTKSTELLRTCFNAENIFINSVTGDVNIVCTARQHLLYDIILMSYSLYDVLNGKFEYSTDLIKKLQGLLKGDGIIIITEPADKQKSTMLMKVRDYFKEYILAPCTHSDLCPLLIDNGWCHFRYDWRKPSIVQNIFYKISCDLPDIKFSYIVIGKEKLHRNINDSRVLTPIFSEKGRISFKICSGKGISDCFILKKDIRNCGISIDQNSLIRIKENVVLNKLIKFMPEDYTVI